MPDMHKTNSEIELDVLKYWENNKIFQKSVDNRPINNSYTFYDGPPFATGLPHYGHILGSVMKDVIPRFWTMRGYRVDRRWGWDCHGLPIENIVEKEFDLKSRKDILEYGVGAFNNRCESKVLEYAAEWKTVIDRLGRWVDMDNAYRTMDLPFMESIWWVFETLWSKGLIYEGRKPMHICPRCETTLSNFEVTLEYHEVTDLSATVAVELTSGEYHGAHALAWTTTPWTLPGNCLLAVGTDLEYALVSEGEKKYLLAADCVERVFAGREYSILEKLSGSKLLGASYNPIFPFFANHANAFRVVSADFVDSGEGTGIVHIAPGFGGDDMALGEAENVAPIMHVQFNGHFVPEVSTPLTADGYDVNRPVKSKGDNSTVDIEVIKWLAHHGKLFSKEKIKHSYPNCWRCDTPLINYATSSWFVRVAPQVESLLKNNQSINWVPDNMKNGRFGKWLEGARDWAISRSRFWGTPIPVWRAEDGEIIVVGSVEKLEQLVGHKVDNLHKHVVDNLVFQKDGKTFTRVPEVLDCWFESGSMPYAQKHYPFENKDDFHRSFPADFIAEGQDQTRGWFYTLHVLANALFDQPAFKNVIVNGIVLAEDGKKMSKKLKNYPDPMELIGKYGADAVRYYLCATPAVEAESLRFSESGVDEVAKKFINILRNVQSFYDLYRDLDDGRSPSGAGVLDAWILARYNEALQEETSSLEAYQLQRAARSLQSFVTDLSTWYLRRSRDRMSGKGEGGGEDQKEAIATLRFVLENFAKMLAPFMPFLAETVHLSLKDASLDGSSDCSIHLEDWPKPFNLQSEDQVLEQMIVIRRLVSQALESRETTGIPIKQVLGAATITVPAGQINPDHLQVFLDEVNVKTATVASGDLSVTLDFNLTPALLREGMAREITRRVNGLRKDTGLTIKDRITLYLWSENPELHTMLTEHADSLKTDVLAESINFEKNPDLTTQSSVRINEIDLWLGF